MRRDTGTLIASLIIAGLSACSANHHSIYRVQALNARDAQIITIDAKQRAILTTPPTSQAVRRFCSEPSPDTFSVMAQVLSAGGAFGRGVDPASIEAALDLAFGTSEQASTIPRTQTINMLRDLMYRTCERYLSGAYDEVELSIQAIRDQRLMVSILAIEQLTGAVASRSVVISTSAGGSAGISSDAIIRLDEARQARDRAVAAYTNARTAYESVNGTDKVCDVIEGKPEANLSDAQKAKVTPCGEVRAARKAALAEQAAKTAAYEELSSLARAGGVNVITTDGASNASGGLDSVKPQAIAEVSRTVAEIVARNFKDDTEVMLFCLRLLRPGDPIIDAAQNENSALKSVCLQYLDSSVQAAEARLQADMQRSDALARAEAEEQFTIFWTQERAANFFDAARRAQFVSDLKELLAQTDYPKADCFQNQTDQAGVKSCFIKLSPAVRRKLIR